MLGCMYLFELEFSSFPGIPGIFFNDTRTALSHCSKQRGALGRTGSHRADDETYSEKLSKLELCRGTLPYFFGLFFK